MKAITRNTPATGAMRLLLTVLLAVAAWTGAHADMVPIIMPMPRANYLYVPQLEYRPGVTVDVPIYLRNTDAVVIQEISCLYLRYAKAHARLRLAVS